MTIHAPRSRVALAAAAMLFSLALAGAGEATEDLRTVAREPRPIRIDVSKLPRPFHTESARRSPRVVEVPGDAQLFAPRGFRVSVYATGIDGPRWLALTPEGEVLVTCLPAGGGAGYEILRLRDADGDGRAEGRTVFAGRENGLDLAFGMAFSPGFFYVGNTGEVRRYPYEKDQERLRGKGESIIDLPGRGYRQHWTRNVRVAPDGEHLFVTVGSRSNGDPEELPRAAVLRTKLDGSDRHVFAHGLRNPVGLDFHPTTGEPHVTVNERDGLGDDLVPDYFTRLREQEFYGWPYAYLRPGNLDPRRTKNGESEEPALAARTKLPDVLFQAHSAALGLTFYRGTTFPERYRGGAYVAFRGSWNRNEGTGYKIVFVPFGTDHRPLGHYEDFVTGFLIDPAGPKTFGRPVGLLELADGSLIFTEEANGRIYRVTYEGESGKPEPKPGEGGGE